MENHIEPILTIQRLILSISKPINKEGMKRKLEGLLAVPPIQYP
jgi:hypothetical protein